MGGALSIAIPSLLLGGGLDKAVCESRASIVDCDSDTNGCDDDDWTSGCLDLVRSELVCELCTNEGNSGDDKSGGLDTDVSLGGMEDPGCGTELLVVAVEV